MANLVVSFVSAAWQGRDLPVEIGRGLRVTEEVAIGSSSAATTTVALQGEIIRLKALAACWVAIGATPDAENDECRYLDLGEVGQFYAVAGDKVAVVVSALAESLDMIVGVIAGVLIGESKRS